MLTTPLPSRHVAHLAAVFILLATATLTTVSLQAAAAFALVVVVVALYFESPRDGLLALWLLWLLAAGLRRMLGLTGPYLSADPMSVAPFAATIGVAALAFWQCGLDSRSRLLMLLAGSGFAFGIPAGLATPQAAAFSLFAYLAAVSAYAIGYAEGLDRERGFSLRRALWIAGPLVALYGVSQYALPLSAWDSLWLESIEFNSIGRPEDGTLRVFSTLNAPGTLGAMLGLGIICALASKRSVPMVTVAVAVMTAALALTFARSAWIALVVGIVAYAAMARGRTLTRLGVVLAVMVVAVPVAASATPAGEALGARIETLGNLNDDRSGEERQQTAGELSQAVTSPGGYGLGQTGESTRLSGSGGIQAPDNGYLSLVYQVGPLGAGLVLLAMGLALVPLLGSRASARDSTLQVRLALIAFLLTMMAFGDLFYGVTGVVLWYILGSGAGAAKTSSRPPRGATP